MKILHVIDALGVGGGAEHSLAGMLPLLEQRGVASTVLCLIPRVGGLQEQLRSEGFDVEILQSTSWVGRVRELRRKIRDEQPDIVHATLFNSCLITRLACVGLGIRQINSLVNTSYDPVRLRDLNIPRWKLSTMRVIDSFTARHFGDRFHAITNAVAKEGVEVLGIDRSRITVIPRGRNAKSFGESTAERKKAVRSGLNISPDTPVVLNIGRQDTQKAQADLIRAFAVVVTQLPDALLLIAGREGDASSEIQRALDESGIMNSVRLLGHRTDIPDLLVAADVFVFPSHYEGLGGSLIEAMALGVPIIGSDAPAIAEVLGNGQFGVVSPRGDVDALGFAIADLLSSPDRLGELSELGRRRFHETYETNQVVNRTIEMYDAVLGEER